jgi:hypothetical protein
MTGLLARGALPTSAIAEQLDVSEASIRKAARVRQSNSRHQKLLTTQTTPVEWVLEPEQDGLERGHIGEVGGRQDRPLDHGRDRDLIQLARIDACNEHGNDGRPLLLEALNRLGPAVVRGVVRDPEDPMSRTVVARQLDVLLTELALNTRQIRDREATR